MGGNSSKPIPSSNVAYVAAALKEAKKAERDEKEYGLKLPSKRSLETSDDATMQMNASSPIVPPNNLAAARSLLSGPEKLLRLHHGEQQNISGAAQNPAQRVWPPMMQYNAYAQPSHLPGSIPLETVRGLLLGHIDPVHLAITILPPEEAIIVARRHLGARPPPGETLHHPQPLVPQPPLSFVTTGSSSEDSGVAAAQGNEDGSSVDSKESATRKEKRALPKKKRKFSMSTPTGDQCSI